MARPATHGMKKTKEYSTWHSMKTRCLNPNKDNYYLYGERGITICNAWHSFENFYEDMGNRPPNTTLDRIDNDKGYYKENCRWATPKKQANNRNTNTLIEYNGKKQTLTEWEEEMGLPRSILCKRLKAGWSIEKSLTTKSKKAKKLNQ